MEQLLAQTADGARIVRRAGEETREVFINLPGGYNIYNAAGAASALLQADFDLDAALEAIAGFRCGFGRMEKFALGEVDACMILIKNPAGCNQVLNFLTNLDSSALFVVCLNDNYADGTDVSWIWDVEFETLLEMGERLGGVLVSGKRCYDMALRLKYAGLGEDKLRVVPDYAALVAEMTAQSLPVFIMPTYTAMLDLREQICRDYGLKEFWK